MHNLPKSHFKKAIFSVAFVLLAGVMLSGCMPSEEHVKEAESLVQEAQDFVADSRYADALGKYSQAREVDNGNVSIYVGLSDIYVLKNRNSDAKDILEEGIGKSREPSDAYQARGMISLGEGEYEEAVTYLKNAVSRDKRNYEASYYLAVAYVQEGSFDDARRELDVPEEGGDWFVRAGLLKAILLGDAVDDAEDILDEISDYDMDDEELEDSVEGYGEVLETISELDDDIATDEYVDVLLGYGALEAGYEDIVIDRLSSHADEESEYWELFLYLGRAYFLNKEYDKAADMLANAVTLNPTDPSGLWTLARISYESGSETDTTKYYERAILLTPSEDRATIRLEYVDVLLEMGQYSSAEDELHLLMQEDEENKAEYELMLAETMLDRDQYTSAREVLDEVTVSGLTDELAAKYYWEDAWILFGEGERDGALVSISDAISFDGSVADYYLLQGQVQYENGQVDEANISLERAVDMDLEGDVSAEAAKVLDRI